MGVTGLSDREEEEGDGESDLEMDTLDKVEETDGGRAEMFLGEEMIFLGMGAEISAGVRAICDSDGIVLRRGIVLSERGRGRNIDDQK